MELLVIQDLHVSIDDTEILKGVNLRISEGEVHALMGPNGNGKSTLLKAVMGHPRYEITQGSIHFLGQDVLEMAVDERARMGLFLGMQYPQEVPGVTNADFMRSALNAQREEPIGMFDFVKAMEGNIERLKMRDDLAHRFLNEGFSGGEKKRNEILQLLMLQPKLAMLDEIDSGLDIDALALVAEVLKEEMDKRPMTMLIVSHYERFFELMTPSHTHIMIDGRIVKEGGPELVSKIDQEGYDWLGVEMKEEAVHERPISMASCAIREHFGDKDE